MHTHAPPPRKTCANRYSVVLETLKRRAAERPLTLQFERARSPPVHKAVRVLQEGLEVTKYSRAGPPHSCRLVLNEDSSEIVWEHKTWRKVRACAGWMCAVGRNMHGTQRAGWRDVYEEMWGSVEANGKRVWRDVYEANGKRVAKRVASV